MSTNFSYTFPAIRGIQAGREYYVSMCPLNIIPKIFLFDSKELPPEIRAQRTLNKARIPALTKYLIENPSNYIFSALTASVDGDVQFESNSDQPKENQLGLLHIPMNSTFIINDGQHRQAAIAEALKENPELKYETIAVVFFIDSGLARAQQMFADLNRYAVRPNSSLNVLYDHRDTLGKAVSNMVSNSNVFKSMTERDRPSLASRSKYLFTLSSFYSATKMLINNLELEKELEKTITEFWNEILINLQEWRDVYEDKHKAQDVRLNFINSYAVTLQALGRVGNYLLKNHPQDWKEKLKGLHQIDWSRDNSQWEGRPLINGAIKNSSKIVSLISIVIKQELQLPLTVEEQNMNNSVKGDL